MLLKKPRFSDINFIPFLKLFHVSSVFILYYILKFTIPFFSENMFSLFALIYLIINFIIIKKIIKKDSKYSFI